MEGSLFSTLPIDLLHFVIKQSGYYRSCMKPIMRLVCKDWNDILSSFSLRHTTNITNDNLLTILAKQFIGSDKDLWNILCFYIKQKWLKLTNSVINSLLWCCYNIDELNNMVQKYNISLDLTKVTQVGNFYLLNQYKALILPNKSCKSVLLTRAYNKHYWKFLIANNFINETDFLDHSIFTHIYLQQNEKKLIPAFQTIYETVNIPCYVSESLIIHFMNKGYVNVVKELIHVSGVKTSNICEKAKSGDNTFNHDDIADMCYCNKVVTFKKQKITK